MFEKLDEFGTTPEKARKRYTWRKGLTAGAFISGAFCLIILGTLILPIVFSTVVTLTPLFTVFTLALAMGGTWMLGRGSMGLIQNFKEWRTPYLILSDPKKGKNRTLLMVGGEIAICTGATLIGLAILANYIFDSVLSLEAVFLVTNPLLLVCLVAMVGGVLFFTAGYLCRKYENADPEKVLLNSEPLSLLTQKVEKAEEPPYSIGDFFHYLFSPDLPHTKFEEFTAIKEELENVKPNRFPTLQ
jgi:MFS family permease